MFLVVKDSLLQQLEHSGSGLAISGLDAGCGAYAADIRAAINSMTDLQTQGRLIQEFTQTNDVKLNASKTEIVKFSTRTSSPESIAVAGQTILTQAAAKCLGVWWQSNLYPAKSIDENIHKARRAYFALGSIGAFQSYLNPLSGCSIFFVFVLLILLNGSDKPTRLTNF